MAVNRLIYAAALGICFLSYLIWGQWLSWISLLSLLALPWVSLALSIPAIVRFRAAPGGPRQLYAGEGAQLCLLGSSPLPVPPFRGKLRITNLLTGQHYRYRPEQKSPAPHCGGCRVTVEGGRVCDFLGLFSFPIRHIETGFFLALPRPLPMEPLPELLRAPRPEEQEVLPWQPGEAPGRIHRKLSAKTGQLMHLRHCRHRHSALEITLSGSADTLDRKLGQLVWLCNSLTDKGVRVLVRVHTQQGTSNLVLAARQDLDRAMLRLLCIPAGKGGGEDG